MLRRRRRCGPRNAPAARLLQRVFGADALRCPRCGASLRLIAAIEDPDVARRMLACLDLPVRAPPLRPASDATPPLGHDHDPEADETRWGFERTSPYDEAAA